jgi:hypothetical protein
VTAASGREQAPWLRLEGHQSGLDGGAEIGLRIRGRHVFAAFALGERFAGRTEGGPQ